MRAPPAQRDTAAARLSVRLQIVLVLLMAGVLALAARAVDLQLMNHSFLAGQGDARYSRVAEISAHRGTITDRYGEPLAVSTPVDSVWVNPKELSQTADQLPRLARALKRDPQSLARRVSSNVDREFLYLARHLQPEQAARVRMLDIPGVYLLREYRRYYPAGEVSGHVLGFTSIDDSGQEGLELAYDHWLAGEDGAKRVIQDRYGHVVENVESIRAARPGKDLVLSLDLRIQYLAYRELKRALIDHRARSGSLVVIDIATGEVLAMVNQPSFNPNDRDQLAAGRYRNRAVTDIFEPGSSIKPFVVAAALSSGQFREDSVIDTEPGFVKVGVKVIEDKHDLGTIDLATVLAKSSNVAMAKIALALDPQQIWTTLNALGFGQVTTTGYPGESAGLLSNYSHWRPIGIATLSYGYGLSVTTLQLAQAYATLGAGGIRRPVTFQRIDGAVEGERVIDERVARQLIHLLESVITPEGTGVRASLTGYRVAGKTGTAWKATAGGYSTDKYISVFAGVVPASAPRLAAVVMIDEPGGTQYYGGEVAAPVFAGVMSGALRLMAIAPDDLRRVPEATLAQAGVEP
jgi:cell division protein FtsI (penicillin-binding protein 3)